MKKEKFIEIILHCILWGLISLFFISNSYLRFPAQNIINEYYALFLVIFLIYINTFLLIPQFFNKKKFHFYFLSLLFIVLLFATIEYLLIRDEIVKYSTNSDLEFQHNALRWNYFGIFIRDGLFVGFFTMFKIYRDAIKSKNLLVELMELERQKLKAEINMVKSKVNSHFFFNSLNSIYALIIKKSDKAADTLIHLSDLMEYVVKDSEKEWVPLDNEIKFLQDYIELERIQHNKMQIEFNLSGDTSLIRVPPMIFESFVNNAFKYTDFDNDGYVRIKIDCNKDVIFNCENSLFPASERIVKSTGKGLQNTIMRLNLHYRNKHQLDIIQEETFYKVNLVLINN
ncbi:MAG: histidine kinase [Bacteroidetes bacterium]|nr:histidine kinase [Bacteroidota bacterium]